MASRGLCGRCGHTHTWTLRCNNTECKCPQPITQAAWERAQARFDKFTIANAKYLAKLNTPEEQAKIQRELAWLREAGAKQKSLDECVKGFIGLRPYRAQSAA